MFWPFPIFRHCPLCYRRSNGSVKRDEVLHWTHSQCHRHRERDKGIAFFLCRSCSKWDPHERDRGGQQHLQRRQMGWFDQEGSPCLGRHHAGDPLSTHDVGRAHVCLVPDRKVRSNSKNCGLACLHSSLPSLHCTCHPPLRSLRHHSWGPSSDITSRVAWKGQSLVRGAQNCRDLPGERSSNLSR